MRKLLSILLTGGLVMLVGGLLVWAEEEKKPAPAAAQEQEKSVKEAEVPPAALAALKALAGTAALTEFSQEIEHGHTFYEGSWKGPNGNVDGLVTEGGDVVEIEESVPADKVPAGIRGALEKDAGKDAQIHFEKKTVYLYEAHYKKDGKHHEVVMTPDGRPAHGEEEDGDED